jgi:hypothetical protein
MEADFQARLHDILRTRSGLGSQLLRTPTPRCSGPREPGVAAASTARRGRFERPRRALAPRLPPPPELRGACGRAAHAHRDGVRAAACRASPRSRARAPPRICRWPSGRRPDKRGGRDERLDGQGRVAGRKVRQRGGAQAADRAWRERQLAWGAPPHVPRVGARVVAASVFGRPRRARPTRRHLPHSPAARRAPHPRVLAHSSHPFGP